ncbi:mechanosensitive ion channel domain-containing protein [Halosimplex aquaticum]|uniref:Mechanosensitive ion channel domain-containing protein n=1 Tax=Halosimplex aquaticum TaxID=3026162 RepID=A0ABD5Y4U4_9EURY|nr:mechanosensitive ion channel domain-containing protein [Halosimplex aquaticum]
MQTPVEYLSDLAIETVNELAAALRTAIPRLVMAVIFVSIAYVLIKIILLVLRRFFRGIYPEEQDLIAQLWVTVVGVFLWFGAGLVLLKILGMGDVAASLGTATGFIALGVSYALSEMIEDAVAGVYLLRDPDFNPGDRVTTQSMTGTVSAIELRKSRFELDEGDTVVLANREVEKRWTREAE